jgi:hypothetical protein
MKALRDILACRGTAWPGAARRGAAKQHHPPEQSGGKIYMAQQGPDGPGEAGQGWAGQGRAWRGTVRQGNNTPQQWGEDLRGRPGFGLLGFGMAVLGWAWQHHPLGNQGEDLRGAAGLGLARPGTAGRGKHHLLQQCGRKIYTAWRGGARPGRARQSLAWQPSSPEQSGDSFLIH